jgi:hypothetical protein
MSTTGSREKGHSKTGILLLTIMFLVSGVVGYFAGTFIMAQPVLAPSNHYAVAQIITITDLTVSKPLTLKYIGGAFSFPSLNQFPPGHTYTYSRWEFDNSAGQVQAFMVVAGPGVDDKTYGIEISRKCWDQLKITVPGGQNFEFPLVTQVGQVSPGYLCFEFIP